MQRLRNPKVNNRTSASKYSNWLCPLGKLTVLEKKSTIQKSFEKKKRHSKFLRVRLDAGSWVQVQQCVPRLMSAHVLPLHWLVWVSYILGHKYFSQGWTAPFPSTTQHKASQSSQSCCVFSLLRKNLCLGPLNPSPWRWIYLWTSSHLDVKLHNLWSHYEGSRI